MSKSSVDGDQWRYQCGHCGRDFGTSRERDQHAMCCGNEPKPKRFKSE